MPQIDPQRRAATARKSRLKREFGLTPDEWDAMFEAQGRVCAACKSPESGDKRVRWHTDHDHESGRVRGILCTGCNLALGQLADSLYRVSALLEYRGHFASDI